MGYKPGSPEQIEYVARETQRAIALGIFVTILMGSLWVTIGSQ